jgi:hypothetical protein
MPRTCSVCSRDDIDSINVALASKEPQRTIAERFELSEPSLGRHAKNHLSAQTAAAVLVVKDDAQQLISGGLTRSHDVINALLVETVATARGIQDAALLAEKPDLALRAIREVRASLELVHKFTVKQLGDSPDTELQEDLKALALTLRRVLPDHRAAARAIVSDLKMQGALHLAATIENALMLEGVVE